MISEVENQDSGLRTQNSEVRIQESEFRRACDFSAIILNHVGYRIASTKRLLSTLTSDF